VPVNLTIKMARFIHLIPVIPSGHTK